VAHGVLATGVEGAFFRKVSGSADVYFDVYVAGSATSTIKVGTLTASDIDYAMWWDGTSLHAYINDVEVTKVTSGLPTVAMTPSFNWRTGASAAITLSVAELGYVSVDA
jgi:hypothetical protein